MNRNTVAGLIIIGALTAVVAVTMQWDAEDGARNKPSPHPSVTVTRLCEGVKDSQCWETEHESGPPVSWRDKPKAR